jgi:hypothetical protein
MVTIMKKTTCIKEFKKETEFKLNQEHYNAVMEQWQIEWETHLENLNNGKSVTVSIELIKLLNDFKDFKVSEEMNQAILNLLNRRIEG